MRSCAGSTSSLRPEESRGFWSSQPMTSSGSATRAFPAGEGTTARRTFSRWLTELWIYDEVSIDVEEIIDLDDRALGVTRFHGVSADAPPADWPWCHLVAFRDGLISQAQSFLDRAEALEAAGLRE